MNYIAFTYKVIGEHLRICCVNISQRPLCGRRGMKTVLGLGALQVIPNVSAQRESNSSDKDVDKDGTDNNAGWERLKAVFEKDEYGNLSKEVTMTIQSTFFASLAGCLYGGVISSRVAFRDFMERNQATIFENHLDAKRRLQNHVTIHFAKGGFRWGLRCTVFTAGFMMFLTSMSAYRGYSSVIDYAGSGLVVGALLRARLGPPAIAVGGALGGILGGLCGLSTQGLLYLTGNSLDDIIAFQNEIDKSRKKLFMDMEVKDAEQKMDEQTLNLLKSHDASNVTKEM